MPYRPTGRAPGRPRGPVTAEGKLAQARKRLPHVRAFPHVRRAVDRAMRIPHRAVVRAPTKNPRDVDVEYRYTPAERGQVLAFTWWVYSNRSRWPRSKLASAITAISPLMLFSSTFFAEMTDLPQSTASKYMIRSPLMEVTRVSGSCGMDVIHLLLEKACSDTDTYRGHVRELSLVGRIPNALLSRISGVPVQILRRSERGIQFFPEQPDYIAHIICTQDDVDRYWKSHKKEKTPYDPQPGDQKNVRQVFAGEYLQNIAFVSAPLPGDDDIPHHCAIPGLPSRKLLDTDPQSYFRRVCKWEDRYLLPAHL